MDKDTTSTMKIGGNLDTMQKNPNLFILRSKLVNKNKIHDISAYNFRTFLKGKISNFNLKKKKIRFVQEKEKEKNN